MPAKPEYMHRFRLRRALFDIACLRLALGARETKPEVLVRSYLPSARSNVVQLGQKNRCAAESEPNYHDQWSDPSLQERISQSRVPKTLR
jgi:hypothetical protein